MKVTSMINAVFVATLLLPSVAQATSYYVSPSGNDARDCYTARNASSPKATLNGAVRCLVAGDTLEIMAGVYREQLVDNIPPGTSWTNAVTIKSYLGQPVVISYSGPDVLRFRGTYPLQQYIIIEGITIDATGQPNYPSYVAVSLGNGVHHIRFLNCTIKNGGYTCLLIGGMTDAEYTEIRRCNIFGSGSGNAIYLSTNNCLIEDSEIHSTRAGFGGLGIWINTGNINRDPVNNIIRRNRIHGNSNGGIALAASFTEIHDNLIYGNNLGYQGIALGYNTSKNQNNKIYNNTFNGNGDAILVGIFATTFKTEIRNNQIVNSAVAGIRLGCSEGGGSSSETIIQDNQFSNNRAGDIVVERASGTVESGNTKGNPF